MDKTLRETSLPLILYRWSDKHYSENSIENDKLAIEAILTEIRCRIPKKKDSPKGKDCECAASSYHECGCYADWSDYDKRNEVIDEILEELK